MFGSSLCKDKFVCTVYQENWNISPRKNVKENVWKKLLYSFENCFRRDNKKFSVMLPLLFFAGLLYTYFCFNFLLWIALLFVICCFLDLDIDPWVEEDDKKKRAVKYTINLGLAIGPKTSRIQENQVSLD
jgi:hypothetical protein